MESPSSPARRPSSADGSGAGPEDLSPLETQVLEEYERLNGNMKVLAHQLDLLASTPTSSILDGLRTLERKTSLVFTLLKASVYSIVLQQEIWGGARVEAGEEDRVGAVGVRDDADAEDVLEGEADRRS